MLGTINNDPLLSKLTPLACSHDAAIARILLEHGANPYGIVYNAAARNEVLGWLAEKRARSRKELKEQEKKAAERFQEIVGMVRSGRAPKDIPENAHTASVQARYMIEHEHFNRAAAYFEKAIEAAPWWSEPYYDLSLVLGKLKNYPAAGKYMQRYLALRPDDPNARKLKDKIAEWQAAATLETPPPQAAAPGLPLTKRQYLLMYQACMSSRNPALCALVKKAKPAPEPQPSSPVASPAD
jgi:tetratricopeptide (TPR) repeat protein